MIAYSRIGSQIQKVSSAVNHTHELGATEDAAFLTYQVEQWYSSLDSDLRMDPNEDLALPTWSLARNRLRVLHYLRKNQLRMLIHRGALFTASSILTDSRNARTAVDLARDTITLLDRLRNTSDIYSSHPVCFNYFLYSALIVIVLAAHCSQAQFHEYCREEFHMALNLIGETSAKSSVAQKLWKIITHLKVTAPETGSLPYMEYRQDDTTPNQATRPWMNDVDKQVSSESLKDSSETTLNTDALNGVSNTVSFTDSGFVTGDQSVDASLLSSELSHLFQAFEQPGLDQGPSQFFDALPVFPATSDSSRSVWEML